MEDIKLIRIEDRLRQLVEPHGADDLERLMALVWQLRDRQCQTDQVLWRILREKGHGMGLDTETLAAIRTYLERDV
jgi:hypothetical protein